MYQHCFVNSCIDWFVELRLSVIRQTNRYWAGIFSDLCIEQVLMGSIKSVGGLTRGWGFEESTRLVWLLSMPACEEVHNAIQDVRNLCSQGDNEVHKDLMKARITRDSKDIQCILDFFGERKPFSKDTVDPRSLSSGVKWTLIQQRRLGLPSWLLCLGSLCLIVSFRRRIKLLLSILSVCDPLRVRR